jgi:divalent metal cation (Fe/Co/Zn/Cd) transporter
VEGVKKAEDIRLRSAGPFIMGDVVIKVDGKTTVQELEDINAKIEDSVRSYIPNLLKLIIQPKPYEEDGQS